VGPYQANEWARQRFGAVATDLGRAVASGLQEAHRLALSAHLAGELRTNDAYGAALKVAQHEQLVVATADVPGVIARKPTGVISRFQYLVVEDRAIVLMPWRFSSTRATRRVDARMPTPVSGLRRFFLSLGVGAPGPTQLVLEQSTLDADELEAQLAEEQLVFEQLANFGRVVTVAFGSNPTDGLFEIGWGDAELVNEDTGEVRWHNWEPLPTAESGVGGLGVPTPASLRPVDALDSARVSRFDAAPLDEDLGLAARPRPVAAPLSESTPEVERAGDQDGQS
jgi:hypothetical protein